MLFTPGGLHLPNSDYAIMVECPGSLQQLIVEFIASHIKELCTSQFSLTDDTYKLYFR